MFGVLRDPEKDGWQDGASADANLKTRPADGKLMEAYGTSRRTLFGLSESALRSRLDDVLVRDGALLRRDEGNGRVLLGEVRLQS